MDSNSNVTTRESLILSFLTSGHRTRNMNLPNPRPHLTPIDISFGAMEIIDADVFDDALHPGTRLVNLSGAVVEQVTTTKLI